MINLFDENTLSHHDVEPGSEKVTLCNNNDQTWFSDTQTSARPLGEGGGKACQARVPTLPLGSSRCYCIEKYVRYQ